jgi:hypothetical protein
MLKEILDKRFKSTQKYLNSGKGEPVFKKGALNHINKILGPELNWRYKSLEEYYGEDRIEEAKKALRIFSFTGNESYSLIKNRYRKLSQGSYSEGIPGFHPDTGGHPKAFDILNHAYKIFKEAQ